MAKYIDVAVTVDQRDQAQTGMVFSPEGQQSLSVDFIASMSGADYSTKS